MERREFLEGTAGAALVGLVPFLAAASREGWTEAHVAGFLDRLERRVEHARAHAANVRRRRLGDAAADAPPIAAALEEAMPAVLAVNVVGQVPVRVQAHPDVQRVLTRHLETVGRTARVVAEGLRAFRDAEDDLPTDADLRDAAIGAFSAELSLEDLPDEVQQRLQDGLHRTGWEFRHRPLRALVDEQLLRFDHAVALAGRPEEALASVAIDDPEVRAQVPWPPPAAASGGGSGGAWGHDPPVATAADPANVLLGVVLLGLGTVVGGYLVVVGAATIWCPCLGIPLLLVGSLILYLCWSFGLDLVRPPLEYDVPVGRWVDTGVALKARKLYGAMRVVKLFSDGLVELAPGVEVGPTGFDGPWPSALPAPDEPAGALIARLQGRVFHPVSGSALRGEGLLELAVNARADQGARGSFRVRISHARQG